LTVVTIYHELGSGHFSLMYC